MKRQNVDVIDIKAYTFNNGENMSTGRSSPSIEVKLLKDLTGYDKRLKIGEVGKVIKLITVKGNRFANVKFNNGACLNVLCTGLQIIHPGPDYPNQQQVNTPSLQPQPMWFEHGPDRMKGQEGGTSLLKEKREREKKKWKALKGAQNVKVVRWPNASFRNISYEYEQDGTKYSMCDYDKESGEELILFFTNNGIEIKDEND